MWFLQLDWQLLSSLILNNINKQEALSSISSAGQRAYTEYSSFSGPSEGE